MTPIDLANLIRRYHFTWTDEAQLQGAIETILKDNGVTYERESSLSRADRPDFMVGTTALEVKVDGSTTNVLRQVRRYCESSHVAAVVLVTTRARHREIPESLNGKPIHVHHILGL